MLLLGQNIKFLRKERKLTQNDVATVAGVHFNAISNYENGKFYPTADVLIKICEFFGVSADDILLKDLASGIESDVFEPAKIEKGNNVLVPIEAQSEYVGKWSKKFIRELSYVNIPGITGEARTFQVVGNAMNPLLMDGDYVACTASSVKEVQTGRVYVIVSEQIQMGYVQVEQDRLVCIPNNKEEFQPYRIPNSAIREVWEARAKVTDRILDPLAGGYSPSRLRNLEDFLKGKFPDLIIAE